MGKLDAIGDQGKIVLAGFLLFLAVWGILDALHVQSDFAKFVATLVTTLQSILLFVVDPRKTTTQVPPSQPEGDK